MTPSTASPSTPTSATASPSGLRITVETILDYLSAGETAEEVLRQHPMLEPEDIPACLAFASRLMSHTYSVRETM